MQDRNKVVLRIGGAEYSVAADEDTGYILGIGEEVDSYVSQLMKNNAQISTTVAATDSFVFPTQVRWARAGVLKDCIFEAISTVLPLVLPPAP